MVWFPELVVWLGPGASSGANGLAQAASASTATVATAQRSRSVMLLG